MLRLFALGLMTSLCAMAEDQGVRSGKATAQWLVSGKSVEAGQSFKTVIRLTVDEPWHVYWVNPGDSGMATTATIELPEGWMSSGLLHPIPKKFKTGDLHGFGHEGTVDYPLEIFVPNNFKGDAEFQAELSWLTCNDEACVPGDATLKLKIVDGKPMEATEEAAACAVAYGKLPVLAAQNVKVTLEDGKDHWTLGLANIEAYGLDPAQTAVFIATPDLVPATANVQFRKVGTEGEVWEATCPKGEYAPKMPEECAVLLVEKGKRAVRVEWKAP